MAPKRAPRSGSFAAASSVKRRRYGASITLPFAVPSTVCCVCNDKNAPVICARCRVVHYCSKNHKSEHAATHQSVCKALATLQQQRTRQEEGLRQELRDEYVGLYWGFYEARELLATKMSILKLYWKIGTRDALQEALAQGMDMLRLSRQDPMGVRDIVPALQLRLGMLPECYDFLKWWAVTFAVETYSFRDMTLPFLDIRGANMAEDVAYAAHVSLSHCVAFVVVKLLAARRLWEGVQVERIGEHKGLPTGVVGNILGFLDCPMPDDKTFSARETHRDVREQVLEMIRRVHGMNTHLWSGFQTPTSIMHLKSSEAFEPGSDDEARVTLEIWLKILQSTPGLSRAIDESHVLTAVLPEHRTDSR